MSTSKKKKKKKCMGAGSRKMYKEKKQNGNPHTKEQMWRNCYQRRDVPAQGSFSDCLIVL